MSEKKSKTVFIQGPIKPEFITDSIAKHSSRQDIGAHSIFLGQVRRDQQSSGETIAIEYSCYPEMAEAALHTIREETFACYPLTCMHIYHSLGEVKSGEISLFVFTSSTHRRAAIDACNEVVERIKQEVAIWGKEILSDAGTLWKKENESA
ncbi:MAG: molybdenum cofactor biosynthesis protein MoaE [Chitinophagaceae bacterium]|nr:molybdenum cofactor biosynthesis protein MoaE [Chitinophagaceae bacterium]